MTSGPLYQAVVLAGGEEKSLYPLTSGGGVKALLPVANKPLLGYPLRTLETAGLRSAIVVRHGAVPLPVLWGTRGQDACRWPQHCSLGPRPLGARGYAWLQQQPDALV
jgi:CTP:molybdopterin cytidylyltransferase MocA